MVNNWNNNISGWWWLEHELHFLPFSWEWNNHPNWRTHSIIFQRGWRKTTNQDFLGEIPKNIEDLLWYFAQLEPLLQEDNRRKHWWLMIIIQWPCNGWTDWLEVPTIFLRPKKKAYVREYPQKIWPNMVQYLHFRILKFPLNYCQFIYLSKKLSD